MFDFLGLGFDRLRGSTRVVVEVDSSARVSSTDGRSCTTNVPVEGTSCSWFWRLLRTCALALWGNRARLWRSALESAWGWSTSLDARWFASRAAAEHERSVEDARESEDCRGVSIRRHGPPVKPQPGPIGGTLKLDGSRVTHAWSCQRRDATPYPPMHRPC